MTVSTFPPDRNVAFPAMRQEPRFQIESKSDEFDLTSGVRLIRRRIAIIAVLIMVFMAAAITVISDLKPSYRAESRLIIHRPLATTMSAEDSGRNEPLDLLSETERLLSRSVAERVIRDLGLDSRPEFNPALRKASLIDKARELLRRFIDRKKQPLPVQDSLERIIPEYYKALRVWRDGEGDVIQIGFDATDPELAAAAPNRLISIYLQERNDSIRRRLDTAEEWIRQRIGEQQERASAGRAAFDNYHEAMAVVLSEDAKGEQVKSLTELNERQAKIAQSRADVKAAISVLEAGDDASLALHNIAAPDNIGAMLQDLRAQERDLDRLLETYNSNAQAVIDMRATILKSRNDLRLAVDQFIQSMRFKLVALDREDASIRSELAATDEQRSRSALAQTELARLQHIVDKEQTALDKLEEQRRGLAGQAMLPGAEIEVLSPAAVPIGPQGRGRLFYVIAALLASVSIAVTAAFVAEMLDNKVRSFDQLAGMARMIPAGFIPRLKRKGWKNPLISSEPVEDSTFDDAIRTVVISLKQSNGGKLPNSIVVTSSHRGEGKSFVAESLAREFVASGYPVLLVDGDLRYGKLDSFFQSGLKHGLNDFLSGKAGLRDVIHHHPASGIDVIPAGTPGPNQRVHPSDVAEIIEMARAKGQTVIFDSSPVLASTDTMHFTALAERTLLVVRWGKTSRRSIEASLKRLKSSRNQDILVTFSNVNTKKHELYNFNDSELFLAAAQ